MDVVSLTERKLSRLAVSPPRSVSKYRTLYSHWFPSRAVTVIACPILIEIFIKLLEELWNERLVQCCEASCVVEVLGNGNLERRTLCLYI